MQFLIKKKKVYPDKNGRWYFYLDEEKKNDIRYLIETDCLSWRAGQITYLYDNSSKYSPIYFNEYDYSTDDPAKLRYYIAEQEKMYFHDIAQIKKIQDEYFFEYYELSGTKMWITNARIAGQFSLFAKTDEGITGFIVDRHSEGLIVGKDEIKMGQLGSCTNEIALNKVRVPRENIIGIAGHGQVIALETLNSGRTGLAAAATAIMNKILSLSKEKLLNSEKAEVEEKNDEIKVNKIDDLQFLNLGHIFIKVLMSESLVFDLISLWDSPSTKSVRMESAISKYFCSELLHEVLYFAEDFFGLEGQTDIYLIEKIRRDARILNIYEGTNEVQRFLVLKDLIRVINEKAFDSEEKIYPVPDYIKNFIKKIKVLKMHLYEYVKKAFELMGDSIASNVTWQPVFFPLVELAGIIVVMESTVRRLWLIESNITNSDKFKELMATALEQVLVFLNQKFELFENKYLSSFNLAKEGVTPPEIAIAEIYSIDEKIEKTFRYMPSDKSFIQILCIVRPTKRLAPFPRIKNGKIAEPDTIIEPSDLGAVVSSLQLKNRLKDKIKITVLTIGQKKYESLLKVLLAGGVDNAVRIDIIDFPSEAIETADIIYKYIKSLPISFNVILSGKDSSLNGQKFLPVLAYKLNYFYFSDILKFNLNNIDENNFILYSKIAMLEFVTNKNNICIELDSDNNNILYTLDNYLEVLGKENIKVISENSAVSLNQIIYEEEKKEKKIIKKKELLSISEIAGISMDLIGRKKITHGEIFNEDLKILPSSFNPEEILFISDLTLTAINQDYVDFALHYADQLNKKLGIILLCYNNEQFKNYLNELKEKGISNVYIIEIPSVLASPYSKGKILELFLESSKHNFNTIISGDKSSILMYNLASNLSKIQSHKKVEIWQSITDVQYDITENKIIIKFKTFDGKLRSKIEIGNELYKFMILEKNVNLYKTENKDEKKNLSVYLTKPEYKFETEAQENIEKYYHKILKALKPELKNAEIIVDLGYGIKNNEGLLLAQSLKDKLQEISGKTVFLGATRKVTQDLKLLPVSYQI
ncbi:acyl-CoA dehydrogenase family protein [Candidatus Desantisbacteria bacterium]|nr:acyl-CoA dehydrogenase family protein [Candidatus Desantisbacteria bacterium]